MGENEKKGHHPGTENLIPLTERTKEEQRELRVRGGKASGEARRRKRDARMQMIDIISCMPKLDNSTIKNLKTMGVKGKGKDKDQYTIEQIMQVAIAQKAMKGDVKAYDAIQRTIGEDPVSVINSSRLAFEIRQYEDSLGMNDPGTGVEMSDGFLDALNAAAQDVFEGDGLDVPANIDG